MKSPSLTLLGILMVLAVFFISTAGWATTHYVDVTDGSDSNTGLSPEDAWKTISKVNAQSFSPGDSILFQCGESWSEQLAPESGTSGNLITYGSYDTGDKPTIKSCLLSSKSYVNLEDIEFYSNSGSSSVMRLDTSHHITVEDCDVTAGPSSDAWVAFYLYPNSHHNKIMGCTISHNNLNRQSDALNLDTYSNYNLLENNIIGDATHYSLALEQYSQYNIIRSNVIHNDEGAMINLIRRCDYNLFEGNDISGGRATPYCANQPIIVQLVTSYNIFRNNIFHDNPTGDRAQGVSLNVYYKYMANIAVENHIYNNVVTNIDRDPVWLSSASEGECTCNNNHVKNNAVYDSGLPGHLHQLGISNRPRVYDNYFANNLFWDSDRPGERVLLIKGNQRTVAQQQEADPTHWWGNTQQDPRLDGNYRPLEGSPCIDGGDFLTEVTSASSSGKTFAVDDAGYFCDGFGIMQGDTIQVGSTIAAIESIDYASHTITLTSTISWSNGDPVSLPYHGTKPDIGAFESAFSPISVPKNLRIFSSP